MAKRTYSPNDRAAALVALDANDGNAKRTAREIGIPLKTLRDWASARKDGSLAIETTDLITIKAGSLAEKLERNLHLMVDAVHTKIKKSTLSQLSVGIGITSDKLERMRQRQDEADPAAEICRLLGYNRAQLPAHFNLDDCSPEDRDFIEAELRALAVEDGEAEAIEMRSTGPDQYAPANKEQDEKANEAHITESETEANETKVEALEPQARTHKLDPRFFADKPLGPAPEPAPFIFKNPADRE